jgi:OTU domain-containing protein 5
MYDKGFKIVEVYGDGNCLFRTIAHQAYGDEDEHRLVRLKCMEYILSEKEYFGNFIVGGESQVEAYVQRKRQNGIWGDDLEIQALSEIYNRPIEIYAYSNTPMRTFHEQIGGAEPFRLSYHGRSHYNSVVTENWNYEKVFVTSNPGVIEDEAISNSKRRIEESKQ